MTLGVILYHIHATYDHPHATHRHLLGIRSIDVSTILALTVAVASARGRKGLWQIIWIRFDGQLLRRYSYISRKVVLTITRLLSWCCENSCRFAVCENNLFIFSIWDISNQLVQSFGNVSSPLSSNASSTYWLAFSWALFNFREKMPSRRHFLLTSQGVRTPTFCSRRSP